MCNKYSFETAFGQVMQKDVPVIKAKIMQALNITTRVAWLARLRGDVEPKISEAQAIEKIFADYGINEVWHEHSC